MRIYHQVYNNEFYNRLYETDNPAFGPLPSGYGAMPYSHGYVRNKFTPHPWNIRLPATYSRLASAGLYFREDTEHTSIYHNPATALNNTAFETDLDNYSDVSLRIGSPYVYGPVSHGYEVVVSGIINPTSSVNPSGCLYCDAFNKTYYVFLDKINRTASFTPILFPQSSEQFLQSTCIWQNNSYCQYNTYNRSAVCDSHFGIGDFTFGNKSPIAPTLMLTEMANENENLMSNMADPAFSSHIVLSFTLQPSYDESFNFFPNPIILPFIFAKDFGLFKPSKPFEKYMDKPNMLDDEWVTLPAMTGGLWKFSNINYGFGLTSPYNGYLTTHKLDSCDYSNAICKIRPLKPSGTPFWPPGVLSAINDRSHTSMLQAGNYYVGQLRLETLNNLQFPIYPLSGIHPAILNVQLGIDNIASGEPFCDNCSSFYGKNRQLISTALSSAYTFPSIHALYTSGVNSRIDGIISVNASGFGVEGWSWQGYTYNHFRDYHPDASINQQFAETSLGKRVLTNAFNICEFGCDDNVSIAAGGTRLAELNKCNNILNLDIVTSYYAKGSGLLNIDDYYEYNSWVDAYLYFGQATNMRQNPVTTDEIITYSPYRYAKRLCDDITGSPKRCSDLKLLSSKFIDDASSSGILKLDRPLLSGGWSYERWSDRLLEFASTLQSNFHYINESGFIDVSSICDFKNANVYITPASHTETVDCYRGVTACAVCSDRTIPREVNVNINSDMFILTPTTPDVSSTNRSSRIHDTCKFIGAGNLTSVCASSVAVALTFKGPNNLGSNPSPDWTFTVTGGAFANFNVAWPTASNGNINSLNCGSQVSQTGSIACTGSLSAVFRFQLGNFIDATNFL